MNSETKINTPPVRVTFRLFKNSIVFICMNFSAIIRQSFGNAKINNPS
jgi:hypothetical protein